MCKNTLSSETSTYHFLISAGRCIAIIGSVFGIYMVIILIGWLVEMMGLVPGPKSCSQMTELGSHFWANCPFLGLLVILVILACIMIFMAIVISVFMYLDRLCIRHQEEDHTFPTLVEVSRN